MWSKSNYKLVNQTNTALNQATSSQTEETKQAIHSGNTWAHNQERNHVWADNDSEVSAGAVPPQICEGKVKLD